MPLCTSCAFPAEHLYTTYSSKSNIRLGVCAKCGNFIDPLIEHPPLLLILDLILLKPRVYLHLLFNRGHAPKDGRPTGTLAVVDNPESSANRDLWSAWMNLASATVVTESSTRLRTAHTMSASLGLDVVKVVIWVIVELVAQHTITTAVALSALRLRGWYGRTTKCEVPDGRQKHFQPITISLTLLYATLLPLVLQLALGIWYTYDRPDLSEHQTNLAISLPLTSFFPDRVGIPLAESVHALSAIWQGTDRIWAGTKLLGGMSAGFGLRVILPTRPLETTAIVLAGWMAAGLVGRILPFT